MVKKVLYIEDSLADITLFEEAVKDNNSEIILEIVSDAESLIDYVNNSQDLLPSDLPDLIISDVSLPKISGVELIKVIKENETLKHLPIIAYSTSSYQKDIDSCKENGASDYYQKPMNYYDSQEVIKEIFDKWL